MHPLHTLLFTLALLLFCNTVPAKSDHGAALYAVEKVLDGDTIIVKGSGKVRLLGINTPEIAHRKRAAEPLGDRAQQRLRQLRRGKKVYLEFDQQRRDRSSDSVSQLPTH